MLFAAMLMAASAGRLCAQRMKYDFNSQWTLHVGDVPEASRADYNPPRGLSTTTPPESGGTRDEAGEAGWRHVTLPRAFNEDEAFRVDIRQLTDTVVWYRKHFRLGGVKGRKVFLECEGVRQGADFYVNGHHVGFHENGVMAVGLDLTPYVRRGDNVVAVRVDNSWDYRERATGVKYQWCDRNFNANYGGMPKNVYLHVTDDMVYQTLPLPSNLGTTGVYIYATDFDIAARRARVHAESQVRNEDKVARTVRYETVLRDADGRTAARFSGDTLSLAPGETAVAVAEQEVEGLHFWSWGYGYLYTVETRLLDSRGRVLDAVQTRTGFRKTRFAEGKVWLNDRVLQLRGYAQRTSNEWPAVGLSVPAWMSDYSNALMVESGANLVRWMHVTPWKQDVESCDRVGLIEAMPAGDAEKDREGRQWEQRVELMRDAIVYNRNNPSILFYECGNAGITSAHMRQMRALRDELDPHGGRAIGCREMLGDTVAEYGGEMLYINKSADKPVWAMEYCRDEGVRRYWDAYSYPYHKEGEGRPDALSTVTNKKKKTDPAPYNHNQDELAVEMVRRWYDYWLERPGQGRRVSSGGVKIIFSDTNTHFRGEENYRTSGVTDAMRIPKDAFFAHQAMWNGWVDAEEFRTYIIGHWNYPAGTVKPVHIVAEADSVRLTLNGQDVGPLRRRYHFLFTADSVRFAPGTIEAVSYDRHGHELSRHALRTAGTPSRLRLTAIQDPEGFRADGADLALVQVEVVDSAGQRCPLDNRLVDFRLEGEAEWRGGIAQGAENCILARSLPVECGVNRILLRSTARAGEVTLHASARGLPEATLSLRTQPVAARDGLEAHLPSLSLPCRLGRGETPSTPSYVERLRTVPIQRVTTGSNEADAALLCDDNEATLWQSDGRQETAWASVRLERAAAIDDICLKLSGWRSKSYPLEVYADSVKVWSGVTEKSLGYVHLRIPHPVAAQTYTIRLVDAVNQKDAFGAVVELAGGAANAMDRQRTGQRTLGIVEADFMESLTERGE